MECPICSEIVSEKKISKLECCDSLICQCCCFNHIKSIICEGLTGDGRTCMKCPFSPLCKAELSDEIIRMTIHSKYKIPVVSDVTRSFYDALMTIRRVWQCMELFPLRRFRKSALLRNMTFVASIVFIVKAVQRPDLMFLLIAISAYVLSSNKQRDSFSVILHSFLIFHLGLQWFNPSLFLLLLFFYRSAAKMFHSICPDGISYWLYRTLVTWNTEERKYLALYSRWSLTVAINKEFGIDDCTESSTTGSGTNYQDAKSMYTQVLKCPRPNCDCVWLHSRPYYNHKMKNENTRFFNYSSSASCKNKNSMQGVPRSLSSRFFLRATGWFYNPIDQQIEEALANTCGCTTDHWVTAQEIPSHKGDTRRRNSLCQKDGRYSCCPNCKYEFCGLCLLPWTSRPPRSTKSSARISHFSVMCNIYGNEIAKVLPEEEEYFSVAKDIDVKCCPKCSLRTEKTHGCNHMVCPCGSHWCYICEERWHNKHYTCREGHTFHRNQLIRDACILM